MLCTPLQIKQGCHRPCPILGRCHFHRSSSIVSLFLLENNSISPRATSEQVSGLKYSQSTAIIHLAKTNLHFFLLFCCLEGDSERVGAMASSDTLEGGASTSSDPEAVASVPLLRGLNNSGSELALRSKELRPLCNTLTNNKRKKICLLDF